jgi:hypothetical protein
MFYFSLLVVCLSGISGLYLGVLGFREYRRITRIADKVSILQVIKIAAMLGISTSLVFFAIMTFGGVISNDYMWSLPKLGASIVVSLILGIIVTLGGMYQIYTTVVFRDVLIRKYKAKDKPENRSE